MAQCPTCGQVLMFGGELDEPRPCQACVENWRQRNPETFRSEPFPELRGEWVRVDAGDFGRFYELVDVVTEGAIVGLHLAGFDDSKRLDAGTALEVAWRAHEAIVWNAELDNSDGHAAEWLRGQVTG